MVCAIKNKYFGGYVVHVVPLSIMLPPKKENGKKQSIKIYILYENILPDWMNWLCDCDRLDVYVCIDCVDYGRLKRHSDIVIDKINFL